MKQKLQTGREVPLALANPMHSVDIPSIALLKARRHDVLQVRCWFLAGIRNRLGRRIMEDVITRIDVRLSVSLIVPSIHSSPGVAALTYGEDAYQCRGDPKSDGGDGLGRG